MNEHRASDGDIPVLTDIVTSTNAAATPGTPAEAAHLHALEEHLYERLHAELSLQVPVLLETALREHLPHAISAKLQADILTALTHVLPGVAQKASEELSSRLAYEVGGLIEQRLQDEIRRAIQMAIAANAQ